MRTPRPDAYCLSVTSWRNNPIPDHDCGLLKAAVVWAVVAVMALLLLFGCGKTPNEERRPTSSLNSSLALLMAQAACSASPGLVPYSVAETHSMEPVIFGNAIVLAERVRIQNVRKGDIILWRKGLLQAPRLHQVYSNNGIRLGVRGVNNLQSDNTDSYFITDDDLVGRYVAQIVFDPAKR